MLDLSRDKANAASINRAKISFFALAINFAIIGSTFFKLMNSKLRNSGLENKHLTLESFMCDSSLI